jgi:glycosyltransferase involved in cell wall biosynthesis
MRPQGGILGVKRVSSGDDRLPPLAKWVRAAFLEDYRKLVMIENKPVIPIPVPDYAAYRDDISQRHATELPLNQVPFFSGGNLARLPAPLNRDKQGWPWTSESQVRYSDKASCPKISVVVPSYQQGVFIEETIRSVLLQNYPNTELIIMDGGSSDDTQAVLDHYRDFLSIAVSEKDRGQTHAVNKGFAIADGELYYWLNSDDYLNRDSFNHVVPYFIKDKRLDIVYGDGLLLNEITGAFTADYAPLVLERYLRFGSIVLSHSVFWRANVHCKLWEDLQCAMDAELWLRLFNGRKARHCHYPVGVFRTHPQQKTTDKVNWSQKWEDDYKKYIWKHYAPLSKQTWDYRQREYRVVQKLYRLIRTLFKLK